MPPNQAGFIITVSTAHKLNSCWIHIDVYVDASVSRRKKPQKFIKDCQITPDT